MGTFGERLKRLREGKKMNQQELAEYMGKGNKTVISSWELNKSKPSLDEIEILADFFEVSTDYLIRGKQMVINEPDGDYVRVPKDNYLQMQDKLIKYQEQEIEGLQKQTQHLKNAEMVVDKP